MGSSALDLTIAAPAVAREVTNWASDEDNAMGSDHEVICFQIESLHPDVERTPTRKRLNWKNTDWKTFRTTLQNLAKSSQTHCTNLCQNPTHKNLDEWAHMLRQSIQNAVEISTPTLNPTPHSKRWWTDKLDQTRGAMS
jgi:hypothetical protein